MLSGFERTDLFPTLIFQARLTDAAALNEALLAAVLEERAEDQAGIVRSNQAALGGWHSRTSLHRDSAFLMLARAVRDAANTLADQLGYDPAAPLDIDAMWAIVNPPGAANTAHVHPGALWSGVYYIAAAPGAGDLEFTDPRTAKIMEQARFANRPAACRVEARITPEPGLLVLFPGWLYHAVQPNRSAADRVIVSFNLAQR